MYMFSKELLELDRNTAAYMVDVMQKEIDEQKQELDTAHERIAEAEKIAQAAHKRIDEQKQAIDEQKQELNTAHERIAEAEKREQAAHERIAELETMLKLKE